MFGKTVAASLLFAGLSFGAEPAVPSWLDTVAPKVTIEPSARYHRTLFHVTLSANEPSQLWCSRQRPDRMQRYRQPITVARDGTFRFFFYGEDDFGNKSPVDSIVYVFDSRPPELVVEPPPGLLRKNTAIRLRTNEPCRFFFVADRSDSLRGAIADTVRLREPLEGFFVAVDSAGNRMYSPKFTYGIDTSRLAVSISPPGGMYRVPQMIEITAPPGAEALYTFDPLAPPEWFVKYGGPVRLPHGLTNFRYLTK
jgi:hypothetical protein